MELSIDADDASGPLSSEDPREQAAIDRASHRWEYRQLYGWIDTLAKRGLQMEIDLQPSRTLLSLHGRLDRQSAQALKGGFQEIMAHASKPIDVDLAGINRVDGLGLAALVWSWRLAQDFGVELRLTRMRPDVRGLVTKMNLHHLLPIVENRGSFLMPE